MAQVHAPEQQLIMNRYISQAVTRYRCMVYKYIPYIPILLHITTRDKKGPCTSTKSKPQHATEMTRNCQNYFAVYRGDRGFLHW